MSDASTRQDHQELGGAARRSSWPGASPTPAFQRSEGPPAEPSSYCIECMGPVYDGGEFCPPHAYLAIRHCDFCDREAIVNDAGLYHCLRPECIRKAADR